MTRLKVVKLCSIAAVVAAMLGGCSHDADLRPEAVQRDVDQWSLPLDPYRLPSPHLLGYASSLIRAECLKKKGFEYPVIPYNENAPGSETRNDYGRALFTVETAKKYGYNEGPTQRFSRQDLLQREEPEGREYEQASDECELQVKKAGIDWDSLNDNVLSSLASSIDVSNESSVKDATSRWKECLIRRGVARPTDTPFDMPRVYKEDSAAADTGDPYAAPTPEEVRVATIDATCQEESGYRQVYYDAEFSAQEKIVEENLADLAPLVERNRDLVQAARRIIAEKS